MNTRYVINLTAVVLFAGVMATSCSDREADMPGRSEGSHLLEVEVTSVEDATRSIIEGDRLPSPSSYGIFACVADKPMADGDNVEVSYSGGSSTMSHDVELPADTKVGVVGYYPFATAGVGATEWPVEAMSQTDYLATASTVYVDRETPKAGLVFNHVMSRITLRLKRSADNDEYYTIPSIRLGGDRDGQYRTGIYDLLKHDFASKDYGEYEPLDGAQSGTSLDASHASITADFLVIPSATKWDVNIDFGTEHRWYDLPSVSYQGGRQYIYDITLREDKVFMVVLTEIREWTNHDMPELELQ